MEALGQAKSHTSEDIGVANSVAPLVVDVLKKEYCKARGLTEDMVKDPKGRVDNSYRLYLVHAVLFLARSPKSRIVDDLLNVVYGEIQHEDKKLPIPDYALDMHTSRGKRKGRSYDHFFSEGNKLGNEVFENLYTKEAKEILIKHGGLKSEFKREEKVKDISKTEKTVKSLETFTRVETLPLGEDTQ